ncbi:peptide deformylase [candidate division WOR-1 bacterium RIFOXYD2_FULL_36_8]|uniref:Peptide deformylase n=1 Tax=candidate division WOR-1 bacterium RIFOXYB2_FULL_36_35 TaxID=1802578 RepID=A0A1F4S7W7_UNCSA|nr:MAG: peptide deformylase [candidate division WOR-1 bacterium RIFOXYA2_FULL_36_21]OGC16545.1 MAG: peptide deformylase [candidate division WOR-1 bacterium RIFOXYB2_FULL_36_35]OGC38724.1 MAG: peptide deformylase [candidate division WOR-1 bacterium RIFOXYD2_FULL_36_8]
MALLKIITFPNPILRKKCKSIKKVDSRIKRLIKDMIDTMHTAPGVGLAAPQIGENIKLIVVDIGQGAFALINPKIVKKNKILQTFEEGCLCLPGIVGPVERPSVITVKGLDKNGQSIIIDAEGFLSTVIQHEIDHLEGIVFIDKIKDKSLIKEVSKKQEEDKKEFI